jgi:membrane fusion protein, multidrug efflux system
MSDRFAILIAVSFSAMLLAGTTGCSRQADPASAASPPPPEVGVITVAKGDVGLVTELPGRLEASRVAQVRARAAGIVQQRLFREGSDVKAGQVLYRIDAAPYEAASATARASLARAEANLGQAAGLAQRYKPLVDANAVSQQDYVNAVAAQKQAEAEVAAARAAVRTAEIHLGYAAVTAPISGRIGRSLVTEGALVGQGEATPLAVIQQVNPLYVNFTQPASDVMKLRRALEQGQLRRSGVEGAQVRVLLEDGTEHGQPGRLLFADLSVDPGTGQVMIRAEVPNPRGMLLPGMFVRVLLEQARAANAVLLPQQAVTRSPQGDTVTVVAADGNVAPRPVKVGGSQQGQWLILDGLQPGEQVMVDGFQKLKPGQPVKPVPWVAAASARSQAPSR